MNKEECQKIIKKRDSSDYTLRHGEYSRPTSKVRKHTGSAEYGITTKYYYYPGTYGARKNGFEDEKELHYELKHMEEYESYLK